MLLWVCKVLVALTIMNIYARLITRLQQEHDSLWHIWTYLFLPAPWLVLFY